MKIRWLMFFLVSATVNAGLNPFEKGDSLFRDRSVEDRARGARLVYRQIFDKHPTSVEAAWRLAMANQFVGMHYGKDVEEKKALFEEGKEAAARCLENSPDSAACHFWWAINGALYGETVGPFAMISSLARILEHLREASRLDPGYAYGGSHRVLGLIYQRLPGILGGSNSRAKEHFEKAIKAAPDEPMNYLFLARLLRDELSQTDEARRIALLGSQKEGISAERVESIEALAELRAFLATPAAL